MAAFALPVPAHFAGQRASWRNLALVAGLHGIVLLTISQLAPARPVEEESRPLMVEMLAPPAPPTPTVAPTQPTPVERKPVSRPASRLPTPTLASSASPSAESVPAAAPAPIPAASASAAASASPAPTQPRFDADYLLNPAPTYPPLSRRLGEEGKVILRVFVEPEGKASQVEIKASSGSQRLDRAAAEAVARWKFIPARRGDEAVSAWVLVPIIFSLRG